MRGLGALTPQDQKKVLVGLLSVIGFALWLNLFLIPRQSIVGQVRWELRSLREKIQATREGIGRLAETEARLQQLAAQHELSGLYVPAEEQLPQLLEKIAQLARSSRVRLVSVKPKADLGKLVPGPSGFLEVPVWVNTVGGYHAIGSFLDAVERSESLVRVQEFEIRSNSQDPWQHQVSFLLQVYLLPGGKKGT